MLTVIKHICVLGMHFVGKAVSYFPVGMKFGLFLFKYLLDELDRLDQGHQEFDIAVEP